MKKESNKKAIIYCRVSTKKQETEGSGLDSQEKRCRQYCESRGYEISNDRIFRDSFTGSGDFMKRPEMKKLFEYLDSHKYEEYIVVFDDLKRFARDTMFHWKLRKEFNIRLAKIECLNFTFEDTPEGEFIETILASQDQLERKQNARQVIQKQKARLMMGLYSFGNLPIGYEFKKTIEYGKLAMPTQKAKYIQEGLEGFAYKKFNKQIDLANFWRDVGIFGGRQRAEKYLDTTRRMLESPFYAGIIEYKRWEVLGVVGKHKPLISTDIFNANQRRLKKETSTRKLREDINEEFPLRGLVRCSGCENTLRGYWSKGKMGKKYPYFSCSKRSCPLYSKTIKRKSINDEFKELVYEYKPRKELIELVKVILENEWKNEMAEIDRSKRLSASEKSNLEREIENLIEKSATTTSVAVKNQYEKVIEKKAQHLESVQGDLEENLDYSIPYRTSLEKIDGMLKSPYKIWLKGDVYQKQKLFFFMFESPLVYEREKGYQTPEKSCITTLFERLDSPNSAHVEMAGIEPACK